MGDYFDMISDDEGAFLAWAGTFNGEQDVYFGRINQSVVEVKGKQYVNQQPEDFSLLQNYPNPFNPSTNIKYTIPANVIVSGANNLTRVTIKVYDVLGNEISVLVNEEKPAGTYEVQFKSRDLTSGLYFYRIHSGTYVETKKMILMK